MSVYCPVTMRSKTVLVTYGGDRTAPRWCELMPTNSHSWPEGHSGSELRLDYGCSGVGRYMLKRHTGPGGTLKANQIRLTKRGHFGQLLNACAQQKQTNMGGISASPVDYVLETACVGSYTTEGAGYCVYGLGLAKFVRGIYRGSSCVVSREVDTVCAVAREPFAATEYAAMSHEYMGVEMSKVLGHVRTLLKTPGVRVFTRGRLAQLENLQWGRGGTTLFNTQRNDVAALIEIGAIALPRLQRHPNGPVTNLAAICVDMAKQSGICLKIADGIPLGQDRLVTLIPDGTGMII